MRFLAWRKYHLTPGVFVCLWVAAAVGWAAEPRVDADYPGGNIRVLRVEDRRLLLAPDQRDTVSNQWWFYWNFRLRAAPETVTEVVFADKNPIGVRGPAISRDGGITWQWMGAREVKSFQFDGRPAWTFEARVPAGATEVRFAFCPPYLEADLRRWMQPHRNHPALRVQQLCRSRQGRPVELLRAGCLDPGRSRGAVLLTSRHHCCESMGTYAMEGFLDAVLAEDALGRRWRSAWEVLAVPFMDKDGVEAGDQGKFRAPHDHNRDYNSRPIYPEVTALINLGPALEPRLLASLDLHCPWIRGEWNDRVYFVGPPEQDFAKKQEAFAALLERTQTGPLRFTARDCLPYGTAWNKSTNFREGRSFSSWTRQTFPRARLAGSMEIPYADARGVEVTPDSARKLGRDLAAALADFLSQAESDPAPARTN